MLVSTSEEVGWLETQGTSGEIYKEKQYFRAANEGQRVRDLSA